MSALSAFPLRLRPGDDLMLALTAFVQAHGHEAACVLACAGSVTECTIRFADQPEGTLLTGKREIVSLSGTLSASGGSHLHIALADGVGQMVGGHLLPGSRVYTTAEIVVGVLPELVFRREPCELSGYDELVAAPRP